MRYYEFSRIYDDIEKTFSFLLQYNYVLEYSNGNPLFLFKGEVSDIRIMISTYQGRVDCDIVYQGEDYSFERVAAKCKISGLRFKYQFHDIESMEKGLVVIANSLIDLVQQFDFSKRENIENLFKEIDKEHPRDPVSLKRSQDLYAAEKNWEKRNYQETRDLLKRWENDLSPKQKKQLDYLNKKLGNCD